MDALEIKTTRAGFEFVEFEDVYGRAGILHQAGSNLWLGAGLERMHLDRATVGETRVGLGTKIDNLVQIGHGSAIGEHTVLAAQVGLAGTTRVGNHVTLAGQVGVAGHLTIGDRVIATARTGIGRSVAPGKTVSGAPEMDTGLWKRNYLLMHKFPALVRTIRDLERDVAALKKEGRTKPE